nr:putative o-acetyltransferase cas1 [Quercus suber]
MVVSSLGSAVALSPILHSLAVSFLCHRNAPTSMNLDSQDPNKCTALKNNGVWYGDHTWISQGCDSLDYRKDDIKACVGKTVGKIVFAGDMHMQETYLAMAHRTNSRFKSIPARHDHKISVGNIYLEYLWDPYLNSSQLHSYAEAYGKGGKDSPMLIVLGPGKWHAQEDGLKHFENVIGSLVSAAGVTGMETPVGSTKFSAKDGPSNLMLFAPAQEPFSKSPETDPELAIYRQINAHLKEREVAKDMNVLWAFQSMTEGQKDRYHKDGIHVSSEVSKARVQLLLNMRCNAITQPYRRDLTRNRGTCCGSSGDPNWVQVSFLILALVVLPLANLLDYIWPILSPENRLAMRAAMAFTAIVSLMYITDRTHIFEQATRHRLHMLNLRNMLIVCGLLGILTIRRSKSSSRAQLGEKQPDQPFLPRDQTDEWKGWMQLLIIVYHYNMAWTADWFWEIIRLAVTSYLFLTGFGHTVFFLQKHDYSFKRFAAVMIRTNLLPVTLAYVMRTKWLLYYYMPLSTFWYVVVYATMAIGQKHNDRSPFLIGKIFVSASLIRAFLETKDLPETLVHLVNLVFKMELSAEFFHHRVKQDQYIVYIGMLAAMLYIWSKNALSSDANQNTVQRFYSRAFPVIKYTTIALSALGLPMFWYLVHEHITSQRQWTRRQPYIAFIPILAFIVLRNAHPRLRNFYSVAFAWLGRYSGEMYVMQDHLWLAADQETVLTTGFFHGNATLAGDRWRDLLLITPLYFIACWIIGDATAALTTWFVKEEKPTPSIMETPVRPPTEEVEMGLLKSEGVEVDGDGDVIPTMMPPRRPPVWQRVGLAMWPGKVRDRALLLLAFAWVLNMTYT